RGSGHVWWQQWMAVRMILRAASVLRLTSTTNVCYQRSTVYMRSLKQVVSTSWHCLLISYKHLFSHKKRILFGHIFYFLPQMDKRREKSIERRCLVRAQMEM